MLQQPSVTPNNHSEKEVQFSELRYRRLFETARDGILIIDADSGKIDDANPIIKRILGYSPSELLGKELWQISVFKNICDSKKMFFKLQSKGHVHYKDLPLQTKAGESIVVELVCNLYIVGTQKVIQCNIRDITKRKKIEQAITMRTKELVDLAKSQEKTKNAMLNVMEDLEKAKAIIEIEKVKDEAMLSSLGEGLIAVDNDRKVMTINTTAEDILGWKRKDMVGKEVTNLPLEDEEGHVLPLNERPTYIALVTGKLVNATYYFVRKDKTRFPIAITVTPIKLGGKIIGAVDIFRDVTHETEIDKAKSEFVSLASHQLRTPLGIIKWYLEALENEDYFKKSPAVIQKYFYEIYRSNERVLSLMRDLLSVSRIEQGRVKNSPQSVNIASVVTEVVEQMQIVARKKKIALHLAIQDQKISRINIDITRFHEVVENLIVNALEYTMVSGKVDVTVQVNKLNDTLVISVKDTGIGICPSDLKNIFTKFFRSEKAVKYNTEGSGLGLYVVKSYVEGWGGNISVESSVKKGSTFTISLPLKLNDKDKKY